MEKFEEKIYTGLLSRLVGSSDSARQEDAGAAGLSPSAVKEDRRHPRPI